MHDPRFASGSDGVDVQQRMPKNSVDVPVRRGALNLKPQRNIRSWASQMIVAGRRLDSGVVRNFGEVRPLIMRIPDELDPASAIDSKRQHEKPA
jgi:hypothetical protein